MTLVKFIEATADYFKYSYETGATLVYQFIELFQNNNAVLGELADELWAPGLEVTVVNKIYKSPNLQAGTLIKCTQIGTTGTTEPDWSTVGAVGSTVTDGGVIWSVIPQTGQEIATQDEVTAGTVANKVVTPATAAGCYLRIWQGTTAPTDLSGRSAWLNTNTDPAALYYYNVSKSAWQSAVAYAAGAGTAANANYVNSKLPLYIDGSNAMTGGLSFGNGVWNPVGDDVMIGDCNHAGCLGIKGVNGATNIGFCAQNTTDNYGIVSYDGTNIAVDKPFKTQGGVILK